MRVLVETSVWSLALRRNKTSAKTTAASSKEQAAVAQLTDLIQDGRACMLGAIRQELLSGIKLAAQFKVLQKSLRAFEDIALTQADHELAAEFFNLCRSNGVQGSNTDFLICAAACRRELPILTTDLDFLLYQKHVPMQLFSSKRSSV
jgi:predicted nucleic acid-binding protein